MQALSPVEISELIKARIAQFSIAPSVRTEGVIVSLKDGIVRIHGLDDVMQGEMLQFNDHTYGMALNLERDSVGAIVLGPYEHLNEGKGAIKSTLTSPVEGSAWGHC